MITHPLIKAASVGDLKTIQLLLQSKADINYQEDQNGYTVSFRIS